MRAAVVRRETEDLPAAWPDPPASLTARAAAVDPAVIWQRIEAWCAWRWSPRSVSWIVEGPGLWQPRLAPVSIVSIEVWNATTRVWEPGEADAAPLGGLHLAGAGPWRITGLAGADNPPAAAVLEAYLRLAEYFAATRTGKGHLASLAVDIGDLKRNEVFASAWMARAMQLSGAGDLLRPYRRAH